MKKILFTLTIFILMSPFTKAQSPINTTLNIGYESRYVLYGYRLSRHLYHADITVWKALNDHISVWGGSWFGTLTDGSYNELDLYAGVDYQLSDHFSAGLAYSIFNYLEVPFATSAEAHELSGHLTWTSGPLTLSLRDLYDSEANGHLLLGTATFDHSLTDSLSLSLSAEYGYGIEYFSEVDGGNHALLRLDLPYQINETLSVAPFIAHSFPLEVLDSFEEDQFYGGINISTSF